MSRTYRDKKWIKPEKSWNNPTYSRKTERNRLGNEEDPAPSKYKKLTWKWDYS